MIEVRNLKKSFGDLEVLKGINVNFEEGKTNLIIGQSGSGKTVFLKCLVGLLKPSSGEIIYKGKNANQFSYKEMQDLRSKIGTVFQGSALFDYLTVLENVAFPLEMFTDLSKKERMKNAEKVLERVNISKHALNLFPAEISGGMQKRVAIARAIVNQPEYLFADEPNSGLDPQTAMVIDNLLQELTREYNTTTIVNTHDMNSVLEIGEKVLFLKNGYKEWEGDFVEILNPRNENVEEFVYSSNLFKKVRNALIQDL